MNASRTQIGTTVGLASRGCDRGLAAAEQVYVYRIKDDHSSHPIEINAWVGYGSVGRMRLTKRQATDLIGLLARSLNEGTEP